jgi:thioredoxin reductase
MNRGMEGDTCAVAVVGGGPAGCAAAIQLARYGLETVLFERNRLGGLLLNANLVENYPGFPEGIVGAKLAERFVEHLCRLKVDVRMTEVLGLERGDLSTQRTPRVTVGTDQGSFHARAVVIATGTRAKALPVSIPESVQERVVYEVWPILDVREKRIAVVGAGDAAFDYALNLATRGNEVVILNRSSRRSCLPLLWKRARAEERIAYEEGAEVLGVESSNEKLLLCYGEAGDERRLLADFMVVAIGRAPEMSCISEKARTDLAPLERGGRLHLIGDVVRGHYRQTAIAVGDGLCAAMKICDSLEGDE